MSTSASVYIVVDSYDVGEYLQSDDFRKDLYWDIHSGSGDICTVPEARKMGDKRLFEITAQITRDHERRNNRLFIDKVKKFINNRFICVYIIDEKILD